ncbi:MAG: type II toxin-antitoxin system MqsR family toxin [Selenomonadaceae bacterium]|nr:type II toxin-antitoxin system MqsR family toxin [Selenomonadaceae bacterium]
MEKFNPTYSLEEFKHSDFEITKTAQRTALELEFDEEDVRRIVLTMEPQHFYKSMTSYSNHKIWQDVYHVPCGNLILYVKFTQNVISEFTLLSFKEK